MDIINFFIERWETILKLTLEHIYIVFIAMGFSIIIGVFLGVSITYNKILARIILNIANILMTIPNIALFSLLIPLMGIGTLAAITGIVLYTQLPIIRNVYTGIININPAIITAARGMGLSPLKILLKIQLPLCIPAIVIGVRTATIMGIGLGAIAAFIGAGGLGTYIFQGISRSNSKMVIIGAVLISFIAIIVGKGFDALQKKIQV